MSKSVFKRYNLNNIILLNYISACLFMIIVLLIGAFIFKDITSIDEYEKVFDLSYFIYKVILAILIGPLIEEFIFRKLLYKRLLKRKTRSVMSAIIISTIIFAALHSPVRWFSVIISSICYSIVYELTDKLVYPIVLHSFNNGLALLWEFLLLDLVIAIIEKLQINLLAILLITSILLIILLIELYKKMKMMISNLKLEKII